MKNIKLSKLLAASMIATSIAVVPMVSAQAQVQVPPAQERYIEENDDFDWGWLGLLGLIGLAGLAGKNKRHNNTVYTDPNRTTTTDYR
jgi:hypothetical protein